MDGGGKSAPWQTIAVEERDGIVTVRLDRPEARNALNGPMMRELTEVARSLRTGPALRAVILAGGADFFSAGADLAVVGERLETVPSLLELREAALAGPDMCRAWEEIEAPTIAAIEGFCVGGACALAVSCDWRILGRAGAMRLPEVPLGINMSWRTLPRLERLMGPARAKRFTIFGAFADAPTCLAWGLADEVVETGEALAEAERWATRIAALPPLPVRMTKETINAVASANHHAAIHMDRDQYLLTLRTADLREGVSAFFEKRPPSFRGD